MLHDAPAGHVQPSAPRFEAGGRGGRALEIGASVLLRVAGFAAPGVARVTGRRYPHIERSIARAALGALGTRVAVSGLEHARGGPFVVLPLHESLMDPLVLQRLPLPLAFAARDEIWEWPSVGRLLVAGKHLTAATDVEPARRVAAARQLLRDAGQRVSHGVSLVVFPQGSVLGIEIAFTRGAFWLARRLDVPVLPVVITGTHRVWEFPFSPVLRRKQRVTLEVLPSLPPDEAFRGRLEIERMLRMRALSATHGVPRHFVPSRDGTWDGYPFTIAPEFPGLVRELERLRHTAPFARPGTDLRSGPVPGNPAGN